MSTPIVGLDSTVLHREPWARSLMRLDDELSPDLCNLVELCEVVPLQVWGALLIEPAAVLARAADFLPRLPDEQTQTRTSLLAGAALMSRCVGQVRVLRALSGPIVGPVLESSAGWGAISRLLLKYVPISNLTCVEADRRLRDAIGGSPLADRFVSPLPDASRERGEAPTSDDSVDATVVTSHDDGPDPLVLPADQSLALAMRDLLALPEEDFRLRIGELSRTLRPGGHLVVRTRAPEYWLQPHLDDPDKVTITRKNGFCHSPAGTTVAHDWMAERLREAGLTDLRLEWLPDEPNITWWAGTRTDEH